MVPRLVIFDCDGVLVDSEGPANETLIANLARHGFSLTMEEAEDGFVGGTMKGTFEKARSLGADLPDDWVDEMYRELFARLRQGVDPIDGIFDLLDLLDARSLPYCVASNGSDEKMSITLGHTGLWERFEGRRFSAHRLGVSKPNPGLYLISAKTMGVAPEHCVVIEDSESGARAARDAGMACLGYAPKGGGEKLAALGAKLFSSMRDAPGLLGLV